MKRLQKTGKRLAGLVLAVLGLTMGCGGEAKGGTAQTPAGGGGGG
jgi:hypothetical protein